VVERESSDKLKTAQSIFAKLVSIFPKNLLLQTYVKRNEFLNHVVPPMG